MISKGAKSQDMGELNEILCEIISDSHCFMQILLLKNEIKYGAFF